MNRKGIKSRQSALQHFPQNSSGAIVANPINLGASSDRVYLELYGTGFQTAGTATATVGGVSVPLLYAGPQGGFAGLDQVDIELPSTLAGKGNLTVQLTAGAIAANPVQITIR